MVKVQKSDTKVTKVLVTGGAGFIGSHLVDALVEEGYFVVVIDNLSTGKRSQINKKAKFIKADIRNLKRIEPYFKGVNLVFHLAARVHIQPSIKDPVPTFDHNVTGTLNVLLASRDAGIKRVVYSASSSAYGDQDTAPLYEEMTPHFKNPYSLSKYVGEEMCRLFSALYGLETVSLRYFNVYGPRQVATGAYAAVLGAFIKQFKDGKSLTIVGDGNTQRDFTHVFDVVKANLAAAKSDKVGKGEVINIGTGKNYSINEVASMILTPPERGYMLPARDFNNPRLTGGVVPNVKPETILASAVKENRVIYVSPRPGETRRSLANISRARQLLGWKPSISLEEGLATLKKL
ncbi:MAG: NAD-dependent epimerase/dehydratase family protein [Patescibacteria group bacterium]